MVGDNCENMHRLDDLYGSISRRMSASSLRPFACLRGLLHVSLVIVLCSATALSWQAAGSKSSANPLTSLLKEKPKAPVVAPELPAAIPEQPLPIPLPDVAARSMELGQILRNDSIQLPTPDQIDELQKSISDSGSLMDSKVEEANRLLAGNPNSLEVREAETYWRGIATFTNSWQQQLLTWANDAQAIVKMVDAQEPVWSATLEANKDNRDLGPVLTVIESNLTELRRLRKQAQGILQTAVKLQVQVGSFDQTAATMVSQLSQTRIKLKGHLLDRDSLPLWKLSSRRQMGESAGIIHSVSSRITSTGYYLLEENVTIVVLVLVLIGSLVLAKRMHSMIRDKEPADDLEADAFRILRHWVALGTLPPLILGYALTPSAPITLVGFIIMLSFVPILIMLPPLLTRRMRVLLYAFAALYGFNWTVALLGLNPVIRRDIQFCSNLVVFVFLAYRIRPSHVNPRLGTWWGRVIWVGVRVAVIILGISLGANLLGYVKLSQFLAVAFIYSTFVAISVFTAVRVFTILLTVGLRSPLAERFAAVRLHREAVARWAPRVLRWIGVFIWSTAALQLLGLLDATKAALQKFLDFQIAGSASGIRLGSLFGFFLILSAGYAIASSIRFLFREEILGRFQMSRGLPELISSIAYYLLLLLVALAAISVGGIELNKFTVLTGAFGVGVGFGLQNIINNFVSGLILQFERPIHIDDIIEVDTSLGKVSRIGIRSSTIQTFQGAEVIIPNATLISSKVINWTLSESQRRRELPVGVAYGSDPNQVLELLRDAANKHELVLSKPAPMVYFKGFGDSSLDFELHFWVMQENNGLLITSEVALNVMKALTDAGIEIPFPQRDLHVRSVDPGSPGLLSSSSKP